MGMLFVVERGNIVLLIDIAVGRVVGADSMWWEINAR